MENLTLAYTNIVHSFRRYYGLSNNEYILCDMVHMLSTSEKSSVKGWCYMRRDVMADNLGLSKQGVLDMVEKMILNDFLKKNSETKHLKSTAKWQEVYFKDKDFSGKCEQELQIIPKNKDKSKDSLPKKEISTVKNLYQDSKESLPEVGQESLPNIDILNNHNDKEVTVASDTPSFESQNEQEQQSNSNLERKKESHPPSSARPPSLKSGKGENTKAVLAYFDALVKKLDVSYVYPKTAAMWNPIHACCGQIYNEVGAEGLSAFFGKVESMFVSETFPFKDKTSITPVFIGSAKVLGMVANYTPQSNNSPETVQLSVLANSGLKTLKIARKCKAYEIAERLIDKQTGVILNEAISQEDKAHIAWITRNITNHINNNTIDKQEWFCEFVVRKQ